MLTLCAGALSVACANRPLPGNAMPFDQAVNQAVDDLIVQTQKLPAFLGEGGVARQAAPHRDRPAARRASGQQTEVTRVAEQRMVQRMQAQFKQFTVSPFNTTEIGSAQYVLNGTLMRDKDATAGRYRLNLALTEIKSGVVIAQVGGAHQRRRRWTRGPRDPSFATAR